MVFAFCFSNATRGQATELFFFGIFQRLANFAPNAQKVPHTASLLIQHAAHDCFSSLARLIIFVFGVFLFIGAYLAGKGDLRRRDKGDDDCPFVHKTHCAGHI